jgi:hypothetical protein
MKRIPCLILLVALAGCNDGGGDDPPSVKVTSSNWIDNGGGLWSIAGTVKNKGDDTAYAVLVTARHYNAADVFLGDNLALANPMDIGGGKTATFDIYCGTLPPGWSYSRLFTEWVE